MNNMKLSTLQELEVRKYLVKFLENEYEIDTSISTVINKNGKCDLAYTTVEDNEDLCIQSYLDLLKFEVVTEVSIDNGLNTGIKYRETEHFENVNELLDFVKCLSFDELIHLEKDTDEILNLFK